MRSVFARLKTRVALTAGSAAALATAVLYGAVDALSPQPIADFAAGESIVAGQWRVMPKRAWLSPAQVYDVRMDEERWALVLEADLTNRTASSSRDYTDVFHLGTRAAGADEPPAVVLVRDGRRAPALHPGMTETVAFVWTLPVSETIPSPLEVRIQAKSWKPVDNLYGVPGWYNLRPIGRLSLPVAGTSPARPPSNAS